MLLRESEPGSFFASMKNQTPTGPLARFLSLFGPALLEKYKPKGIVVFSAHWEEPDEVLGELLNLFTTLKRDRTWCWIVSNYEENPLLMDYYGFEPAVRSVLCPLALWNLIWYYL